MIITDYRKPNLEVVEGFKSLLKYDSVTCAISDTMGRFNAMWADMRPLFDGIRLVGVAVTAQTLASDIGTVFKAIEMCTSGDIVVVDSHGSVNTAFWGENMTISAMNKGAVAAVIDGGCRDVEEIRKLRFPIMCRGIVPNVGSVTGYGHVNVPIQCAGVSVCPGDILIIDGNGVVVVPVDQSEDILEKATKLLEVEHIVQEKIKAGATIGALVNIDGIMGNVFAYQNRAKDSK